MRIIVFGGGGGIGGWICEAFSEQSNIEQIACVRNWSSAVRLARRGVRIARLDIGDTGELPSLLTGADVVVNATMPPPVREPALVRGLYAAAAQAGVRRFIQFSSAAVYGDLTGRISEESRPSPNDGYSNGKAEMERLLLESAVPSAPQLFIFRPSIVYGPFADFWTVRYVDRIIKGKWRGLGRAGVGTCNLVHARDVARLVIAAATADIEPGAHVLNVNGPDHVTWNGYIERLGDALEMPGRMTPNLAMFRASAFVAEMMRSAAQVGSIKALYRRSTGTTRLAMTGAKGVTVLYPTPSELKLLRRNAYYVSDKAVKVLGVSPSISLHAGTQESVDWCRIHGIV